MIIRFGEKFPTNDILSNNLNKERESKAFAILSIHSIRISQIKFNGKMAWNSLIFFRHVKEIFDGEAFASLIQQLIRLLLALLLFHI